MVRKFVVNSLVAEPQVVFTVRSTMPADGENSSVGVATDSIAAAGFSRRKVGTHSATTSFRNALKGALWVRVSRKGCRLSATHAAHCIELAQRISDPKGRLSLLEMSRMWLRLAELSETVQSEAAISDAAALVVER
jgi:hypothetical protein